jgi:hypothetical protein
MPDQLSVFFPALELLLPWDYDACCDWWEMTIPCRWPKHHFIAY